MWQYFFKFASHLLYIYYYFYFFYYSCFDSAIRQRLIEKYLITSSLLIRNQRISLQRLITFLWLWYTCSCLHRENWEDGADWGINCGDRGERSEASAHRGRHPRIRRCHQQPGLVCLCAVEEGWWLWNMFPVLHGVSSFPSSPQLLPFSSFILNSLSYVSSLCILQV